MKSDLSKPIWAVMTSSGATVGLKHAAAWRLAKQMNDAGKGVHATVVTAAAAQRIRS